MWPDLRDRRHFRSRPGQEALFETFQFFRHDRPFDNLIAAALGQLDDRAAGGLVGGYLTQYLGAGGAQLVANAASSSGLDLGSIIGNVAGGGVGGLILTAIVGAIKNALAKS